MDELTPLRTTRDDMLAPRPEVMADARAALLNAAESERAARSRTGVTYEGYLPVSSRANAAVTTWFISALAGTDEAKGQKARRSHPRASAIATGVLVSAVVLTGGATVWMPQFGVEPGDEAREVDLTLPVEYTTLSGEPISCTYAVSLSTTAGRADVDATLTMLRGQDWTTFGEDVKQAALADPFTESGPEWKDIDDGLREKIAFERAAAEIVIERAGGLLPEDTALGSTTDCSGRVS